MQLNKVRITKQRKNEEVIEQNHFEKKRDKSSGKVTAPSKSEERVN